MTAAVVVAELLRMGLGGHRYEVVDGSLRSLEELRQAVVCNEIAKARRSTRGRRLRLYIDLETA